MYGDLEQSGDKWQLRFTRQLTHAPEKVWRAVTEPEHLEAWFPQRIVGEWVAGGPLKFESTVNPSFDGEVIEYDPPKVVEFRWGTDVIRIEVAPSDTGSTLTLLDTFAELGKAARDGAGWHVCLEALVRHVDGDPSAWDGGVRWREVHPGYVEKFGPEASTLGPPTGK